MKIKKFEATTEQAAIEKVRAEMGDGALVLSIKTTKPRGIFRFFRKPVVEVTAALDEAKKEQKPAQPAAEAMRESQQETVRRFEQLAKEAQRDAQISERDERIERLEALLVSRDELLRGMERKLSVAGYVYPPVRRFKNNVVQTFFDQLITQGVKADIAAGILDEFDAQSEDSPDLSLVVGVVYDKLVDIIGEGEPINAERGRKDAGIVVFIGPTGVGKTTTIAKLSADFIINKNLRAGLITADTYRIAAVEQLKVYADILGIDVGVVYNKQDMSDYIELMRVPEDIILIDTAGRSHRNAENMRELKELLDELPGYAAYLVLSLTTKYEDMLDIVNTYAGSFDFNIIFTKLDETLSLGAALNLCYETRKQVSYITFGQNVPEDIQPLRGEDIARALLGGEAIGGGRP